jgi:hypothetical protein
LLPEPFHSRESGRTILAIPPIKPDIKKMEVKNVKTCLKKVVFGAATLFLLMAIVTPAISASTASITDSGAYMPSSDEVDTSTQERTEASASTFDETAQTSNEPAIEPVAEAESSDESAQAEEAPTEAPQEEEVLVDPEIVIPENGNGKGKGKGQGHGYLLNNFKKSK